MALKDCYECKKQISDQAAACPHCGAPLIPEGSAGNPPESEQIITSRRQGSAWEAAGFITILAGLLISGVSGSGGSLLAIAGFIVFLVGRFK